MNMRDWLEKEVEKHGEALEAIVVDTYTYKNGFHVPDKVLTPEVGLNWLDHEYGEDDMFPMLAWTQNWVFFILERDGVVRLSRIPRHPVECVPCIPFAAVVIEI